LRGGRSSWTVVVLRWLAGWVVGASRAARRERARAACGWAARRARCVWRCSAVAPCLGVWGQAIRVAER